MKTRNILLKNFLLNTDETGRFIVKSLKTGVCYLVEPIDNGHGKLWGDVDVASKTLKGNYGHKFTGGIRENESLIQTENGVQNIALVAGSPFAEIQKREERYLQIQKK